MFARMLRDNLESCNGRIRFASGNWVFSYTPTQEAKTRERCRIKRGLLTGTDATGRKMYLISQKSVICRNPQIGKSQDFPQYKNNGGWSIPATVCRKCSHYRKSGEDRLRYPHCDWLRKERGGAKGALKEFSGALNEAVSKADDMIKGCR